MNNNKQNKSVSKPKCGLCGSRKKKLTKTICCGNWICDDAHMYHIFVLCKKQLWQKSCSKYYLR